MNSFTIAGDVAKQLPAMEFVVVIGRGLSNAGVNGKVSEHVESATSAALEALQGLPNAQSHARIAHYRDTLKRACNVPSKKFPQSNESLYKRILKDRQSPPPINPIVDFYNGVSIKHGVTAGAFDLQDLAALGKDKVVELRFSRPGDTFLALGSAEGTEAVSVPHGELSYCVGDSVLTRQLAWRQAVQGLVKEDSKDVLFMSEVLDERSDTADGVSDLAEAVRRDFTDGLAQYFGVDADSAVLGQRGGELVMQIS